jgi:hypothetical protein
MIPTIGTMIEAIGIMIAFYIISKMLWVLGLQGDSAASGVTKFMCVIAVIASGICIWFLFTSGSALISSASSIGGS